MEGLIGIAIAIGLIVLAVHYWQITLALAVLGAGVYYLVQENKKALAREKAEEAERLRHEAEQNSISSLLKFALIALFRRRMQIAYDVRSTTYGIT